MTDLESLAEQLLNRKGLANLEPVVKNQMRSDLASRIEASINVAILDQMPAHKIAEFNAILDEDESGDLTEEFIRKNVPNVDGITKTAIDDFVKNY